VRDALNRTNRFEYDGAGRMIKALYANGSCTSNQFNSVGQRIGQVDQAGLVTQFGYDVSGQLTNVAKPQVPDPGEQQPDGFSQLVVSV
jgi:YD repeat-containing protein